MWWLVISLISTIIIYWLLNRPYQYWRKRGVKQAPYVVIFGNNWRAFTRQETFADMVQSVYNKCINTRYLGCYQMFIPTLLLKDADLIKQITVKDFEHFIDHRPFLPEDTDPLWGKNLFSLTGQRWRDMRTTLSPAFTGSKMKYMFSLISKSGEQFVKFFLEKNKDVIVLEFKDATTRFTNDVIANTAFGIECDSLREPNNEFYVMGKLATDFSGIWKNLKFMLMFLVPKLFKWFGISAFSNEVGLFFHK